jgi:hypothetical protein
VRGVPRGQPRSSENQMSWLEVKRSLHWPAKGNGCGYVYQMKEQRGRNCTIARTVYSPGEIGMRIWIFFDNWSENKNFLYKTNFLTMQ